MIQIVINTVRNGSLALPTFALQELAQRKQMDISHLNLGQIPRDDRDLVALVNQYGSRLSVPGCHLKVITLTNKSNWQVTVLDKQEHVVDVRSQTIVS